MWARRCGAPKRSPSRLKVIFFSFFSGTIGLSVYMYMAGSNISYLDLASPASEEVLCLREWPLRDKASPVSLVQDWLRGQGGSLRPEELLTNGRCEVPELVHASCRSVSAPVHDMKRPLALAMGGPASDRYDVLGTWAHLFLVLTFFIWIGMLTHDMALIGQAQRDFILDVTGVNQHCPIIRSVWRCLAGYRSLARLASQEKPGVRAVGVTLAVILAPVLLVWNVAVFNFVVVPLLLLAFARHPIRMSRAWVFIVCIACAIYGLALAFLQIGFMASEHDRPHYAVTWQPAVPAARANSTLGGAAPCTCGCDYPISMGVLVNLTIIGAITSLKSIFVAFRCLKGLRRTQWANLLSVLFPVPVTIYSVDWKQANGQPIKYRTEDISVQEEIAFDPFAMMDEQLDSAFTTVHLRPEPVHTYKRTNTGELTLVEPHRKLEMPSIPAPYRVQVREAEYVGCCGFPWPTGGRQVVYDTEFMETLGVVPGGDVEAQPGGQPDGKSEVSTTAEGGEAPASGTDASRSASGDEGARIAFREEGRGDAPAALGEVILEEPSTPPARALANEAGCHSLPEWPWTPPSESEPPVTPPRSFCPTLQGDHVVRSIVL